MRKSPLPKPRSPRALLGALAALALVAAGCSEDDGAQCVSTVCDPATHGEVCVGQAIRTCAPDGKSFRYQQCGGQSRCDAGECIPRVCTTIGQSSCLTPTSVQRCADDGSKFETIPCATGELCKDGACVPDECESEPDRCTNKGYLTCVAGAWSQETCPVGQLCSVTGDGRAQCRAAVCTPQVARCDGNVAKVCDARGTAESETPCGGAEVCREGHCQAAVCGDTGAPDASDADVVETADTNEPESQVVFTLNGATTTFDQSAYASFDGAERALIVKSSKSTRDLEIRFQPANATVSGTFSSEVFNPVKVIACYDSGGSAGAVDNCPGGFTHQSSAYEVVVTRNDGPGGRFEATFTLTLEDENRDTIQLLNGQIGVKYR